VVVCVGLTDFVPDAPVTAPTPLSIVMDVALLTLQVRVADSPVWIVVGLAVKLWIVGALGGGGVVESLQAIPAIDTAITRPIMNHFFIS